MKGKGKRARDGNNTLSFTFYLFPDAIVLIHIINLVNH
jgi:hypothetical protein